MSEQTQGNEYYVPEDTRISDTKTLEAGTVLRPIGNVTGDSVSCEVIVPGLETQTIRFRISYVFLLPKNRRVDPTLEPSAKRNLELRRGEPVRKHDTPERASEITRKAFTDVVPPAAYLAEDEMQGILRAQLASRRLFRAYGHLIPYMIAAINEEGLRYAELRQLISLAINLFGGDDKAFHDKYAKDEKRNIHSPSFTTTRKFLSGKRLNSGSHQATMIMLRKFFSDFLGWK